MNMALVLEAIQNGHTDRDAICRETGLSAKAAQSALQNLVYRGRIVLLQTRSAGRHKGRIPGIYGLARPKVAATPAVNSVWSMGAA